MLAIWNCHFWRSKNSNIKFQILQILSQDSYIAFCLRQHLGMSLSRGYICLWETLPSQTKRFVGETETALLELQEQALDSAELSVKWKRPPLYHGIAALSVMFAALLAHPAHLNFNRSLQASWSVENYRRGVEHIHTAHLCVVCFVFFLGGGYLAAKLSQFKHQLPFWLWC